MTGSTTLVEFLDRIFLITGLRICVYDTCSFTEQDPRLALPYRLRVHSCEFCTFIKNQLTCLDRCIETEYAKAAKARVSNSIFVHTCYAGITDVIMPLQFAGKDIGALYMGQVATEDRSTHSHLLQVLSRDHNVPLEEAQKMAEKTTRVRREDLTSNAPLLEFVRAYIEQLLQLSAYEGQSISVRKDAQISITEVPTYYLDKYQPESEPIKQGIEIIRHGYWEKLNQVVVARQVNLSPSQFSRRFREETGFTFRHILSDMRMHATSYLLKQTDLNVKQIADRLGYSEPSALHRAFRLWSGHTPHDYVRSQPAHILDRLRNMAGTEQI